MFYISVILLAALIAVQIAKKSGIPSLMLFLSLGIVSSLIGFNFNDYQFAENFSKIALLIIIFYGGFGTNWKAGRTVIIESLILSTLGVIFTSLLTGTLIHSTLWLDRELLNWFNYWLYGLRICIEYSFFKESKFEIQYCISFRT